MKLKCRDHGRRVIATNTHFVHRCGDGSRCNSQFATIGDCVFTHVEISKYSHSSGLAIIPNWGQAPYAG
jgi:hypothetical protein